MLCLHAFVFAMRFYYTEKSPEKFFPGPIGHFFRPNGHFVTQGQSPCHIRVVYDQSILYTYECTRNLVILKEIDLGQACRFVPRNRIYE